MFNLHKWSALIISIFITLLICIIVIFLLDKIVPISKNLKWVENSNIAYYNATSWIEEALLSMSWSLPWYETWATIWSITSTGISYSVVANWSWIPEPGKWNSYFRKDYNRLWLWEPLQLIINTGSIAWSSGSGIILQMPDLNNDTLSNDRLAWSTWSWLVNWMLSWENNVWSGVVISASWETNMLQIWTLNSLWYVSYTLGGRNWVDLNWSGWTFQQFYSGANPPFNPSNSLWNCSNTQKCVLKFSLIKPLVSSSWATFPYLEYKFNTSKPIPLQFAIVKADWYSYWFKRSIEKQVRQITTNEALDFTVFQ